MKRLKRVLAAALCGITAFTGLAACGGNGDVDPATTLYIANYDGAAGHTWLDYFIEEYKKVEPTVTIAPINKKEEFSGDAVMTTMPNDVYDLYFTDHSSYHTFVASGVIADITDAVTEKVYDENGELSTEAGVKSIADILYPEMREFYGITNGETTSYYGLPTFYPISGITYDADLFNERKWFFDRNGKIGVTNTDPNLGPGPDGDYTTTADNGEPETWGDFLTLLRRIKASGNVTPFTWAGAYIYQRQYFLKAARAAYEGKNNADLWNTLNGTDSVLGEITEENAYKLIDQNGVKAMLTAAKDIAGDTDNYSENAFKGATQTHTAAEEEYVYSINTNKRIAMLLESSYWENEARGVFADMEEIQSEWGYGKRNFRMMNMPRFAGLDGIPDQTNEKQTYYGDASTKFLAVSANSTKKDMAKKFIQFIHSRKMLSAFTTISGTFRPFDYEITAEEKATATPFMQNLMDKVLGANSEVVIAEEYSSFIRYRSDSVWDIAAKVGSQEFHEPMNYLKTPASTVKAYFDGMKTRVSQSKWTTDYGKYAALRN